MGRAPCCDKANVKKGPWSPEEDAKLKAYIEQHGTGGNWIALPQKIGLKRCGKSCRLRWLNYLRPNIKHGGFSEEEDNIICSLYISIGSRWSIIAAQLPGRTDNDIKNYWNTRLKKKLLGKQRKEQQARRPNGLKQEITKSRESGSFMLTAETMNRDLYWPHELPVSLPAINQQDPNLADQESIRKLLIKLGGRFSDDYQKPQGSSTNFQYPLDISSTHGQLCKNDVVDILASSTSMDSINCSLSQLPNTHYHMNGAVPNMVQGLNNFQFELDELFYGNPQQLDGMQSFCGKDMINTSTGTSSVESTSWGDISSLVYPHVLSNYEADQQELLQDCAFEESRFFGLQ